MGVVGSGRPLVNDFSCNVDIDLLPFKPAGLSANCRFAPFVCLLQGIDKGVSVLAVYQIVNLVWKIGIGEITEVHLGRSHKGSNVLVVLPIIFVQLHTRVDCVVSLFQFCLEME